MSAELIRLLEKRAEFWRRECHDAMRKAMKFTDKTDEDNSISDRYQEVEKQDKIWLAEIEALKVGS